MEIINNCSGFQWDRGNMSKNVVKHQVASFESEQVFFNAPLLLLDYTKHSSKEKRYFVLGKTNANRKLFIAFTIRNNYIRIISARDMSKKERKIYDKAQENS